MCGTDTAWSLAVTCAATRETLERFGEALRVGGDRRRHDHQQRDHQCAQHDESSALRTGSDVCASRYVASDATAVSDVSWLKRSVTGSIAG